MPSSLVLPTALFLFWLALRHAALLLEAHWLAPPLEIMLGLTLGCAGVRWAALVAQCLAHPGHMLGG